MDRPRRSPNLFIPLVLLLAASPVAAQGTIEDYRRALTLEERYAGLVVAVADAFSWTDDSERVTFRRSVRGGHEFLIVNAASGEISPAFDHDRLAAALSAVTGMTLTGTT
ncbi:MAG: hypothetical protein ACRELX_07335, partial [Longimicrobiales bacterium]